MIAVFRKHLFNLKRWVEHFSDTPHALSALFLIALAESSFFPIPPDVLLIAIATAVPKKALKAALACTAGSVIGGALGYLLGYSFMETLGQPIVEFYHAQEVWDKIVALYQSETGMWFLASAAFTPIPYKIATISAGATEMSFWPFIVISSVGRAARFFLVALLFYFYGAPVKAYIDRYFEKLAILFLVLLLLGFFSIKYFF